MRSRGGPDIHGIAPQSIQLGDHQDVAVLQLVQEPPEAGPLGGRNAARDDLRDGALRRDAEARGRDLLELVIRCLVGRGRAATPDDPAPLHDAHLVHADETDRS